MRLIFLGTGTSAGVPVIACDCRVCTSTDPRDRRLRTGAALRFTETRPDNSTRERVILIDATPDLRQQALTSNLRRCDAILFTHNHVDHTFGLDEVRRFNAVQHSPIDIFADQHTLDHLNRIYAHIFDKHRNINDSFVATLIPRVIQPLTPFTLFGLTITPLPLLHGKLPILGYKFELATPTTTSHPPHRPHPPHPLLPLAYCTDVSAIPPETWPHLQGLRTLALDALRYRRHPTHLSFNQAIEIAQQISPEKTYFIHMTHDIAHAEAEAELPENIRLAHDGLEIG
ncbi:MAG: MBL fold metallo-hydrolase [Phycisphaerales bacterium]|nr:MBL fold metallo-hydrolase [Phycisphaerales bacterium]